MSRQNADRDHSIELTYRRATRPGTRNTTMIMHLPRRIRGNKGSTNHSSSRRRRGHSPIGHQNNQPSPQSRRSTNNRRNSTNSSRSNYRHTHDHNRLIVNILKSTRRINRPSQSRSTSRVTTSHNRNNMIRRQQAPLRRTSLLRLHKTANPTMLIMPPTPSVPRCRSNRHGVKGRGPPRSIYDTRISRHHTPYPIECSNNTGNSDPATSFNKPLSRYSHAASGSYLHDFND